MQVDRAVDIEVISALVTGVPGDDIVLVLNGEAGVGKTVLLDAAAEIAAWNGTRVLPAAALEFEAGLRFGASSQLLQPMAGYLDRLEVSHRDAMRVIMRPEPGSLPTTLLAGSATLALLRVWAGTEGGPVLLMVDDVQWLGLAGSMVLIYALRRLGDISGCWRRCAPMPVMRSRAAGFGSGRSSRWTITARDHPPRCAA
ncbi:ATP-binding protein [Nocardia sp. NPDC101769]|uniref:ATP-binding protein n=1 Tax=Nocardia sp. NPDC101769 TaxID=3364333 RepID=UPI0038256808